jgi:SRSO17 transposase
VAVSLSLANDHASLPIAYQLYLPEEWAQDSQRRAKAGVPEAISFRSKPTIALAQIRAVLLAGVAPAVVIADAGYGGETAFRTALTRMGLTYIVGIPSSTSLWAPGTGPLPPQPWSGRGRPPTLLRRDPGHKPVSARKLAKELPETAWHKVTWREGSKAPLTSRFAAVRVRPAHRDYWRATLRAEEWCLIEWPEGEKQPTKYWLSTLPEDITVTELVDLAKLRWRIERDYQELKQEIGLGHFEGRGWRGFHHHATLCIAAYGFLVAERSRLSPSAPVRPAIRKAPRPSKGGDPCGRANPSRTPHSPIDRYHPG